MFITKYTPIICEKTVIPGSTIVCEFKLKGTKNKARINVAAHIQYKHPIRQNMTNAVRSEIHSAYTSPVDDICTFEIKIPDFKNGVRSYVIIYTEPMGNPYMEIFIENLIIEGFSIYKKRKEEREKSKIEKLKAKFFYDISISDNNANNKNKLEVVCEGLMLGNSGFANAMRNITFELDKYCDTIAIIRDTDNIRSSSTQKGIRIIELGKLNVNNTFKKPYFWITMSYPLGIRPHDGCYSIGYAMFETETFPDIFVTYLKGQDEIWTPSNFCKDSMIKSGLDKEKVFVMPLGVDTELFNPEKVEPYSDIPKMMKDKYKFLCVSSFNERKGMSILIRAFVEEFNNNENVALYIKSGSYNINNAQQEIDNILKDIKNNNSNNNSPYIHPPYIHLHFKAIPDSVLVQVFKMADAFVLPTRGEGWCLPCIEALAMAMPTITTRWGGQLDFMNDDNSYLIDIEGIKPESKCDWMSHEYIGRSFAVPNKNHLRQLMRYIFEHREEAIEKGKNARDHIVKNFTWEKSCYRMRERLRSISQGNI